MNNQSVNKYFNVQGIPDFDWEKYESDNKTKLKTNRKIKINKNFKDKVFSFSEDTQKIYNQYLKDTTTEIAPKEMTAGSLVKITDFYKVNDSEVLATINGGSNSITIDLNKENKWFGIIELGGVPMTKDTFIECLEIPEHKKTLLNLNLVAKVNGYGDKASIWNGYVENLVNEMKEQITLNNKAYWATVDSTNAGGYYVTIADTIKAYMPRSMSAANRVLNFDELIGKHIEVMVESFDEHTGFIVSRKKFIKKIIPNKMQILSESIKNNPNQIFKGTVTGTTKFGIFIELDEFLTGMLHKTLISDELNQRFKNRDIKSEEVLDVYVHKIENGRIILSDVPTDQRDKIINKREKEDEAEKLKIAKATANFNNIKKENNE